MNKLASLLLFLLIGLTAKAQREADNWYFGRNAGVSFQSGTPIGLTNGRLNTLEGCSSISDSDGNLLFYTDGSTVYNANHVVMANGTGLNGDFSSTSSGLIVPQPNTPGIYIIFTVDEPHHFNADGDPQTSDGDGVNDGLNYSVVDMTLNGGLGGVTTKNVPLVTYDTSNQLASLLKCSEKITAVKGADCNSIWLITHFVDTFYAFRVDDTGVVVDPTGPNPSPVVSQVGIEVPLTGYRRNALGYLKASPDGTRLGVSHFGVIDTGSTPDGSDGDGAVALYDFDDATGVVSNEILLRQSGSPYGVEFSPNGTKMYATLGALPNGGGTNFLLQYDLQAADIAASEFIVDQSDIFSAGALQLGPDGRIYRALVQFVNGGGFANDNYLGIINNPEDLGPAVTYNAQGVLVDVDGQRGVRIGLPPFIQSIFSTIDIIQNDISTTSLSLCEGDSYRLEYEFIAGATYTWSIDGVVQALPPDQNFYDLTNVTVADAGTYELEVDLNNGDCPLEGIAVVMVTPIPQANDSSLQQCDLDPNAFDDGISTFNLNQAYDDITGNTPGLDLVFYEDAAALAADTPIADPSAYRNTVAFNQTILVQVVEPISQCAAIANLDLIVQALPVNIPNTGPYFACDNDPDDGILEGTFDLENIRNTDFALFDTEFYRTIEDALTETNPVSGDFTTENIILYARAETNNQCEAIDVIQFFIDPLPVAEIDDTFILCLNDPPLTIEAEDGFQGYRWYQVTGGSLNQISNQQTADIFTPGTYRLEVIRGYNSFGINRSCSDFKDFEVLPSNIATFIDFEIQDISSENNIVTILVEGEGDYEYAIYNDFGPYQDSNVFENVPPGFIDFYVRDKNGCGVVGAFTAAVIGYPKYFTPNGDSYNDFWQIRGITSMTGDQARIFIFDRYGKLLKQLDPFGLGWNGTFNNKEMPADDYWFTVQLLDGREFKGHFTLKR